MQNLKYAGLHFLLIIVLYICYALLSGHNIFILQCNLNNWDVWHYLSIRDSGYYFNPHYQSNVAFFPGFPYLWKISGLNIFGISALNIFMFYTGLLLLSRKLKLTKKELLLVLAIPSMMFMYIPYSEALFFLSATVLLIGLAREDKRLIVAGFFLCSVSRSAANVFLPAIIIMELVCSQSKNQFWRNLLLYSFAVLAGVFIVAFIQFIQTGEAFGFLQTQKNWHHKFSFPRLPLWTWGDVLKLDGAALLTGFVSTGIVLKILWERIIGKKPFTDKVFLFSALYLAGVTWLALSFKQGGLFSLNRYVFPTAFFVIFLPEVLKKSAQLNKKQLIYFFAGFFLFASVTVTGTLNPLGIFNHIMTLIKFIGFVVYIFGFLFIYHQSPGVRRLSFAGVYIISVLIQIYFLFQFLDCAWVG